MSLVERVLRSLKSVAGDQARAEPPAVSVAGAPRGRVGVQRFAEIARRLGAEQERVEEVCLESEEAEEWCSWIESVLGDRRRDPPSSPVPNSVLGIIEKLLERGFRDPIFERVVEARRQLRKLIEEVSEKAVESVEEIRAGRYKVAREGLQRALETMVREVRRLRGDPEQAVSQVLSSLEGALKGKFKVPVEEGELAERVVRELKEAGLEKAVDTAVSIVATKFKALEQGVDVSGEVKRLGGEQGAEGVELIKKPVVRM